MCDEVMMGVCGDDGMCDEVMMGVCGDDGYVCGDDGCIFFHVFLPTITTYTHHHTG